MIIFAKNSLSRTCLNRTVVLTIVLTAFGNALAQSINSLDIDRGNSMRRAIKSDIEENYYDPRFRGLDIEALFKQAKDRINKADSNGQILARVIQPEKRGTVIGDRSAGAVMRARHYSHTVGVETVTFYGVSVTNADMTMTDGRRLEGAGVTPDEFLIPGQLDLAAGRDPVMARALALAGVNVSSEKARTLFPVEWKK